MYCIYTKEDNGNQIIHIEGKLDSANAVSDIINNSIHKKHQGTTDIDDPITIDLAEVESISEDCLKLFKKFKSTGKINFINYSLYVEVLLKEYGLI